MNSQCQTLDHDVLSNAFEEVYDYEKQPGEEALVEDTLLIPKRAASSSAQGVDYRIPDFSYGGNYQTAAGSNHWRKNPGSPDATLGPGRTSNRGVSTAGAKRGRTTKEDKRSVE
ncbi:hypothetical protein FGB62_2g519 [Gracilaria domingensis]|nr:hypothetical protein FGB62_2g519 [Gracilaria domingensis]